MKRWLLPLWMIFAIALVLMWLSQMDSYLHAGEFAPSRWIDILDGWLAVVGAPWLTGIAIILTGYIVGERVLGKLMPYKTPTPPWYESGGIRWDKPGNPVEKPWRNQSPILSISIGLGVIAWVVYVLGLAGGLRWYVIVPPCVLVWIWGWRSIRPLITSLRDELRGILSWHWTEKVLFAVIVWYICRTLPSVTNPATGWDECNSHLVLPKLYVQVGGIEFYEYVNFSTFPPFLHMLLSIQQMFTPTPGAVLPYLFHVGTLAVIWMLVRDVMDSVSIAARNLRYADVAFRDTSHPMNLAPLLACLLYLAIPMTTQSSQAVLTDPVLTMYSALLLWYVLHIWGRVPSEHSNRVMLVMGFLAGCVISIKYTGLIWVGLVSGIILWWAWLRLRNGFNWWIILVMFFGAILLYCSPWIIRNVILFGNPIFPTLDSFIPEHWGVVDPSTQARLSVNYWSMLDFFRIWNLNILELFGLSDPAPWSSQYSRPDETGPWLLIGTPLIFMVWRDLSRAGKIAVSIGLAYIAVWLLGIGIMQTRYFMPAFPVLCAGIGVAVTKLMEDKS